MGAYIGDYFRAIKGYTRPLDYGSYEQRFFKACKGYDGTGSIRLLA